MANNPDTPPDDGKIRLPRVDNGMNKIAPAFDRKPEAKGKPRSKKEKDEDILKRARKRFDKCVSFEGENRKNANRCLNFINNKQWDDGDMKAREGRPTIMINQMKVFVNQVANSQRENRPSINISPDGAGDKAVAKMLKAVIRKMERDCGADIAYDKAFWNACAHGWGWWRIKTDYAGPDTFDQVIEIAQVPNSFSVYSDPQSIEPDNADSKFNFVTEMIDREDFKRDYPDADPINFEGINAGETYRNWVNEKQVRVAEYFEVKKEKRHLVALSNGWIGTEDEMADDVRAMIDSGDLEIENEREAEYQTIKWYKMTAKEILDRKDWPGQWIPLIKVVGNEVNIEGKTFYTGVINDALDSQRMLNFWASLETELLALSPKVPFVIAEGQLEDYADMWDQANVRPMPYLVYKPQTLEGGMVPPPQRNPAPAPQVGIEGARQAARQDIQATTGIRFDATMHERTNDESGRALREIRRATDISTFHFIDNFARSLIHSGRVIVDLIEGGKVIDTKRLMTGLHEDGKEEPVMIDPRQAEPSREVPNPLKPREKITSIRPMGGRWNVTVTTGPSYATRRIEAAQSMSEFLGRFPMFAQATGDLVAKNMDWPDSEAFAARLAKMVPPQMHDIQQLKNLPPEVQGIIGSQQNALQQMQMQMMQIVKAYNDRAIEFSQKQDKIDKDFEAKILGILQKAQSTQDKEIGGKVQALADQVTGFMDVSSPHRVVRVNS